MDFLALYGETGMIGVVGAMFVYLVVQMSNKAAKQQETLENLECRKSWETGKLQKKLYIPLKIIPCKKYKKHLGWKKGNLNKIL